MGIILDVCTILLWCACYYSIPHRAISKVYFPGLLLPLHGFSFDISSKLSVHLLPCMHLFKTNWVYGTVRSFYCLGILVPKCKSWCICMCIWVYRCLNGSCISQYDFLILNKQFIKFVTLTIIYCNTPLHVYVQAYNVPVSQSKQFHSMHINHNNQCYFVSPKIFAQLRGVCILPPWNLLHLHLS